MGNKKQMTVAVWACVFGQDTKIKTIRGDVDEVVRGLHTMSPVKSAQVELRRGIEKAVFSTEVEWCCGHQIGIEVLSIKRIKPDQDAKDAHPAEEVLDDETLAAIDPSTRMCMDPYSVTLKEN